MTIKQAIIQTLIWSGVIALGVYIAFKVFWAIDESRMMGILSWFLVLGGSIFFSVSLTRILLPISTDFNVWILADKEEYKILKQKVGKRIYLINSLYLAIFFTTTIGIGFYFISYTKNYKRDQLMNFGLAQRVLIRDNYYLKANGNMVEFDFIYEGKKYRNRLSTDIWHKGDSVTIYFSTNNTDIVAWEK